MNYCAHKINGQFVVIRVKKSNNIEQQETTRDNRAKKIVALCCPLLFLLFECGATKSSHFFILFASALALFLSSFFLTSMLLSK